MKNILVLLLTITIVFSCKEETVVDEKYVLAKFQESVDQIDVLEYRVQRIDTFAQGGTVWNNTGTALIEKDNNDDVLGYSFYGKRDDVPVEYIYDEGTGFEISIANKTYETGPGHRGLLGSPGGQMVRESIFKPSSIYKSVSLEETEDSFLLSYEFEDDTSSIASDRKKTVELNKTNFLPFSIRETSIQFGKKSVSQANISDIKINGEVTKSIKELKQGIKDFAIVEPKERQPSQVLSKEIPSIELSDLNDQSKMVKVDFDKLTLIDFWEAWCGPCISSFPKVEALKVKYSPELNVIGVVSEELEDAMKLVEMKGITFQNLVGNDELRKTFEVSQWPLYYLVDSDGIVQKQYFGFSDQIEKDIKDILAEKA